MESIKISELKAKLSAILKRVRKGERFAVMDRSHPVAVLMTLEKDDALPVVQPARRPFRMPAPVSFSVEVDAVALLIEDRSKR
jgi:prevent-host-death family protein